MSETNWKSPGAIIGIITALVAVVGLYFAFRQNNRDDEKVKFETEQTEAANRRQRDIDEQARQELQEKKDRLNSQISDLESQINACNDNIGRANMEMALTCNEADDNHQRRCQEAQDYKASNESTKADLESKKGDLERQLN